MGTVASTFSHSCSHTEFITVAGMLIYFYVIPLHFQARSVGRCSFQETLPSQSLVADRIGVFFEVF